MVIFLLSVFFFAKFLWKGGIMNINKIKELAINGVFDGYFDNKYLFLW